MEDIGNRKYINSKVLILRLEFGFVFRLVERSNHHGEWRRRLLALRSRHTAAHPAPRWAVTAGVLLGCQLFISPSQTIAMLPIGITPSHSLDLAPVSPFAGAVWGVAALAHYSLEAALLGDAKQRQAVFEWFG